MHCIIDKQDDELKTLKSVMRKKQTTKTVRNRCQILIDLDEAHGKVLTHEQSAKTNCVCMATIANTIKLYSEKGIEGIISLNRNINSDNVRRKFDGWAEARIIEIACGLAPEGHSRWTLRLLEEYSSRNVARYLRINNLIRSFKDLLDDNRIALLAVVDMSYLSEEEQGMVYKEIDAMGVKLKPKMAEELRKQAGELTEDAVEQMIGSMVVKKPAGKELKEKLPEDLLKKYFEGMDALQVAGVVEQALEAWFSGREGVDV